MHLRSREAYRGTALIARTYRGNVRGKAWCEGRELASIEGLTEDGVLAALREKVDEAIIIETEPGSVDYPTQESYEATLRVNLARLSEKYRSMLRAHFEAPKHIVTAADLAAAASYPSAKAATVQYAKLGRTVGESLLFQPRARASGVPIWTLLLAEAEDETIPEVDWRWRMRPQLVAALKNVGLV